MEMGILMPVNKAQQIVRSYATRVPIDVFGIARGLGYTLVNDSEMKEAGVACIDDSGKKIIKYKAADPLVRQRFTVAHEIGHHELGHLEGSDKRFRGDVNYVPGTDPVEIAANTFAAELLVPTDILEMAMEGSKRWTIEDLARAFKVSSTVITYRLKKLGYL